MAGSSFAERLKQVREEVGLSQYALAQQSGLSKQAISALEAGDREPAWDTVQRICLALGVDCSAFTDASIELPKQPAEPPRRGRPPKAAGKASGEKGKPKKGGGK